MDAADAFWAAHIASRFTDPMISAIVATGELSDPDAARYLTDVIIRRRDKVVAYWIGQTNPLDRFAVRQTATGPELTFDNAAGRLDLAKQETSFRAAWLAHDNTACVGRPVERKSRSAAHAFRSPIALGARPMPQGFATRRHRSRQFTRGILIGRTPSW